MTICMKVWGPFVRVNSLYECFVILPLNYVSADFT